MRAIILAPAAAALLALAPAAHGLAPPAGAAASCSATAEQLVERTRSFRESPRPLRRFVAPFDIRCHDFTGDGRRDVAFAIESGGTGGAFRFAVFRRRGDGHRKVIERSFGAKTRVFRKGRRLKVLNPIFRMDDPSCCPRGGAYLRTYRFTRTQAIYVGRVRLSQKASEEYAERAGG